MSKIRKGIVRGREVVFNRDGSDERLMLQVEITNKDDMQTVEYIALPGTDGNPIDGSKVFIFEVGPGYKIAIGCDDGVVSKTEPGEQSLYAIDDNADVQCFIDLLKNGRIDIIGIAAAISLLDSGIIEINGNADFAVRFAALETALQSLITQINAAFSTKADAAGSAGTIAVDFSPAKVEEVKLP